VLIIFAVILQTIAIAQMLSNRGEGAVRKTRIELWIWTQDRTVSFESRNGNIVTSLQKQRMEP